MSSQKKVRVQISTGKGFYIGDIGYVLGDELYHGVWGEENHFRDGAFRDPVIGLSVAVAGTAYGDGSYKGSDGTEFPVDAGVIGAVPLELVEKEENLDCGRVIEVPGLLNFEAEGGHFRIELPDGRLLTINTEAYSYDDDGEDDYEDEWDDYFDEEDYEDEDCDF